VSEFGNARACIPIDMTGTKRGTPIFVVVVACLSSGKANTPLRDRTAHDGMMMLGI
jgi:hypothetical protein